MIIAESFYVFISIKKYNLPVQTVCFQIKFNSHQYVRSQLFKNHYYLPLLHQNGQTRKNKFMRIIAYCGERLKLLRKHPQFSHVEETVDVKWHVSKLFITFQKQMELL